MIIHKCKMCGGDLLVKPDSSVAECEYCGSKQTVPSLDSEKKATLFNRANKLRAACDFDKASTLYENIAAEYPFEAEAFWGLILCKYGIEYVDDPGTEKKIPTCHRSSFESVFDDANFDLVMENSDVVSRDIYRNEAKEIEELRKNILAVSSKEEPYDIFICYKESEDDGSRTIDSVLAQDIYTELSDKGYRVFFSRISLEDKIGQEYEPFIFAALNSARVMLVVGTTYDHYNAVWVKNEWSRFLKLISVGQKKTLIPCYKNLDAYDMPKEFGKLQAQDLGKIGAIQDLLRGIDKIFGRDKLQKKETIIVRGDGNDTAALLKRARLCLENKEWEQADLFFEQILNSDAENVEAYIGKLLVELKCTTIAQIKESAVDIKEINAYKYALRFADDEQKNELKEVSVAARKNYVAQEVLKSGEMISNADEKNLHEIKQKLESFKNEQDVEALLEQCEKRLEEIKAETRKNEKKKKMMVVVAVVLVLLAIAGAFGNKYYTEVIRPNRLRKEGQQLLDQEKYKEAVEKYIEVGEYEAALDVVRYITDNIETIDNPYVLSLELLDELKNYIDVSTEKKEITWIWFQKILDSAGIVTHKGLNSGNFVKYVTLSEDEYPEYYKAIGEKIENLDLSYEAGNITAKCVVYQKLLTLFPKNYKNINDLNNLLALPIENTWGSRKELIKKYWDYKWIQETMLSDQHIYEFLSGNGVGNWKSDRNGTYYFTVTKGGKNDDWRFWSSYNLPCNKAPANATHNNIIDRVFILEDDDGNKVQELYRLDVNSYNSITFFCYSNKSSIKLTREG